MRIAFICGSLEPGRDGVGDYISRLAGELCQQAHITKIIALNDQYVKDEFEDEKFLQVEGVSIIRLPSEWTYSKRIDKLNFYIKQFKPDWISLQFVPYSFHSKGLPFKLGERLLSIDHKQKWHVMFHEIWIDKPEKISQKLIKFIQKFLIVRLMRQLKPKVIHVSIPYNRERLKSAGLFATVLGLFGNIPFASGHAKTILASDVKPSTVKLLYFGGAPRGNYLEQVVKGIEDFCKSSSVSKVLHIVSGHSVLKDEFISILLERLSPYNIEIIDHGFVESAGLSTLLSTSTVGIARSEPNLVGKSGSVIAMLEHGLPVWMPKWKNNELIELDFRAELIFADLNKAVSNTQRPEYVSQLPLVAKNFLYQLNSK